MLNDRRPDTYGKQVTSDWSLKRSSHGFLGGREEKSEKLFKTQCLIGKYLNKCFVDKSCEADRTGMQSLENKVGKDDCGSLAFE